MDVAAPSKIIASIGMLQSDGLQSHVESSGWKYWIVEVLNKMWEMSKELSQVLRVIAIYFGEVIGKLT